MAGRGVFRWRQHGPTVIAWDTRKQALVSAAREIAWKPKSGSVRVPHAVAQGQDVHGRANRHRTQLAAFIWAIAREVGMTPARAA